MSDGRRLLNHTNSQYSRFAAPFRSRVPDLLISVSRYKTTFISTFSSGTELSEIISGILFFFFLNR